MLSRTQPPHTLPLTSPLCIALLWSRWVPLPCVCPHVSSCTHGPMHWWQRHREVPMAWWDGWCQPHLPLYFLPISHSQYKFPSLFYSSLQADCFCVKNLSVICLLPFSFTDDPFPLQQNWIGLPAIFCDFLFPASSSLYCTSCCNPGCFVKGYHASTLHYS